MELKSDLEMENLNNLNIKEIIRFLEAGGLTVLKSY